MKLATKGAVTGMQASRFSEKWCRVWRGKPYDLKVDVRDGVPKLLWTILDGGSWPLIPPLVTPVMLMRASIPLTCRASSVATSLSSICTSAKVVQAAPSVAASTAVIAPIAIDILSFKRFIFALLVSELSVLPSAPILLVQSDHVLERMPTEITDFETVYSGLAPQVDGKSCSNESLLQI
jgi:hypothetical protein